MGVKTLSALVASIVLVLLGAPLAASAASTDTSDFSFVSYDADYYLSRDTNHYATLKTVETLVAKFPNFNQNRGIIRAIPNDYDGVPLHTTVVGVTNGAGAPVAFTSSVQDGYTDLALGTNDYVQGEQTYQITYRQKNVVRYFSDVKNDEFYWDTNGTGFAQPFGSVTARVHIDPSIAPDLDGSKACYRGAEKSTTRCAVSEAAGTTSGERVFTSATKNLAGNQTMTVAIGFTSGTFTPVAGNDSFLQRPTIWSIGLSILLGLFGLAGTAFAIYRKVKAPRDSKGRRIIIAEYSPPKNLDLLESAAILARPQTAVAAQLVSFAVRGNVRILDYPTKPGDGDFSAQFLNATGVDDLELGLLKALFGPDLTVGAHQDFGAKNSPLARSLAAVQASVPPRLIGRKFTVKPSMLGGLVPVIVLFVVLMVSILVTVVTAVLGVFSIWIVTAIVIALVGLLIAVAVAGRPAVLTDSGAGQKDYLRGVQRYLKLAEAKRFEMLQSPDGAERIDIGDRVQMVKLYEKMLPFAVLWGVERQWSKELVVYYDIPPEWFVAKKIYNEMAFHHAIGGLTRSVNTSFAPTPGWSSGSGSSRGSFLGGSFGGGFSGGGGGGGGGGGR